MNSHPTVLAMASLALVGGGVTAAAVGLRPAQPHAPVVLRTVAATTPAPAPAVNGHTLTVVGEGTAAESPDVAVINVGVDVQRPELSDAFKAAGDEMATLIASLRRSGVAQSDIQTQAFGVSRTYQNSTPTGYDVTNSVEAKLRDVRKVSAVLTAAVGAVGNDVRVNGISLETSNESRALRAARASAVDAARDQAEQWAALTGRHVGQVISVSEVVPPSQPAMPACYGGCGGGGGGVPVSAGLNQVGVQVVVVYALDD